MAWLDPQWFTPEALVAEWRRKDVRKWLIGVATTAVVLALFCHPETVPTAICIDSVGIDVFLALLEVQLIVALLICRDQLLEFLRTAYVSDDPLGTVMRKAVAGCRYLREGLHGAFREEAASIVWRSAALLLSARTDAGSVVRYGVDRGQRIWYGWKM